MLRVSSSICRRATPRSLGIRYLASAPDGKTKETPEEIQRKKEEAAKLAMQSIRDIGGMFGGSVDKETEEIDTLPIYEDPSKFGSLSLLHQGQVLAELQKKFDGKWTKLTAEDKKLGYYISYGNWGPREKFDNWDTQDTPYDLPFTSRASTATLKPTDVVKKLPPLYLSETPIRKDQFDTKKMDGVTKVFIYFTLFIVAFALYRDKVIGEEGKPTELIIRDPHEEERQRRNEQKLLEQSKSNKWYYLWLR